MTYNFTLWLTMVKMDSYSGQGSESLVGLFDQVEKYMAFYHWDEQETYRQARGHFKTTALS